MSLSSVFATEGIVTAPHHLAADAGRDVLRDGGNAVEAMIAMAAAVAVVYPHMNAIGGDGFWIVKPAGKAPVGIDACGAVAAKATDEYYRQAECETIPTRGPMAANTVAGTLSGWQAALELATELGGEMRRERLLEAAIHHGEKGFPATGNQSRTTREKLNELNRLPGYEKSFLLEGIPPGEGALFHQPRLAATLRRLAADGFDSFYRGDLAEDIAADLARAGSPVSGYDLARHRALRVSPLSVKLSTGMVWNMPPPTQGLASLMILGLYDRMAVSEPGSFDHIHRLVECVKQAFLVRNAHVQDPDVMDVDPGYFLTDRDLDARAVRVDPETALPWPVPAQDGDTIWMGAIDAAGNAVSFIQSIYWEFGSGIVLENTGILWQNRGSSFSLNDGDVNRLAPGRRPFHTLNPAMAELADGRILSYGTMGGEGQPQTQGLVYTRHVNYRQPIQHALSEPRFLLGRTWGDTGTNLKLESRFESDLVSRLNAAGHDTQLIEPFSDLMGHAGAVSLRPDGVMEGGSDPRADGKAAGV
ncbi:MAG: gamma-glutamyltransferase family protein [Pseudomonadota bacterium]|nr:gamma-glutamyltransferase family protein [Pseudomonadota bacterium]